MPTPARTSLAEIVAAGRGILEADGLEALTLARVASVVGVRAPSLYKRIGGRGDLIRRIANDVAAELGDTLEAAAGSGDPRTDLRRMAGAVRAFAKAHPRAYGLLFAPLPEDWRVDPGLNTRISARILEVAGAIAGPAKATEAARLVVAWLHGFLTMELSGAFRLEGDVDAAFDYAIDRILAGLTAGPTSRPTP
jgi:AcrR family transcriptional regulator